MFTNEFDHDEISITILDEGGNYGDVNFIIYEDIVYIRQWNEEFDAYSLIELSPKMFEEFLLALDCPDGAFYTKSGA